MKTASKLAGLCVRVNPQLICDLGILAVDFNSLPEL
jgi:hypothetical protein